MHLSGSSGNISLILSLSPPTAELVCLPTSPVSIGDTMYLVQHFHILYYACEVSSRAVVEVLYSNVY